MSNWISVSEFTFKIKELFNLSVLSWDLILFVNGLKNLRSRSSVNYDIISLSNGLITF